jgi:hypothetical protein
MGDELESIENVNEEQIHPFFGKRRLNSAEKYFNWASKTNRKLFERKKIFIFYFFSFRSYGIFARQTVLAFRKKR